MFEGYRSTILDHVKVNQWELMIITGQKLLSKKDVLGAFQKNTRVYWNKQTLLVYNRW